MEESQSRCGWCLRDPEKRLNPIRMVKVEGEVFCSDSCLELYQTYIGNRKSLGVPHPSFEKYRCGWCSRYVTESSPSPDGSVEIRRTLKETTVFCDSTCGEHFDGGENRGFSRVEEVELKAMQTGPEGL